MKREDLIILATNCGMIKTPPSQIKPLWLASDAQLEAFAQAIIKEVKQNASEFMVTAIKKAVEYERNECAKIASQAGITDRDIARQIKERSDD